MREIGNARRRSTTALSFVACGLILLATACRGGSPDATEAPTGPLVTQSPPPTAGSPAPADKTIDLATDAPATILYGADSGDYFNDLPALTSADFNADGIDDLLIGARFGDGKGNARENSGEVYVFFGRKTLPDTVDLASGADLVIYGAAANDQLGFSAAAADLNNDGVDDIVVASPLAQRPDNKLLAGVVYVIFGRHDIGGEIDLAGAGADLLLLGDAESAFFGDDVAATDANGDGATDLIVGATFARRPAGGPNPGAQAGAAYVFFGGEALTGTRDMARGEYGAVIYGENASPHPDEFGDNVAGADINGDGIGDVIVTAEAADGPGNARSVAAEVHVLYGSTDLGGVYDLVDGDQDVSVWGAELNDTIGFNLATGDVNSDGVDDLLISARGGDGPNNSVSEGGEVHIILGGELPETIDFATDESHAYIYGDDQADMIGFGLAVFDVDGDGASELLIGANFGDGPANSRPGGGEAFAIDVRPITRASNVLSTRIRLAIFGAQPDDGLGAAIAGGDFDGDGRMEVAVMADRADADRDSRRDAGEIYILRP